MNETNGGHIGGREIAVETMATIVVLAAIVGGVYLWDYFHGNDLTSGSILSSAEQRLAGYKPTPAQLAASLQAARDKLAKQSAELSAMKAGFPSSPALDKQIIDAYAAAAAAVAKTDKLFNDPNGDPALKSASADPAAAAAVESLRREINADLADWKKASAEPPPAGGSTLALSQKALADLETMQTYFNQLQNYFADLPPSNALQSDVIIADQSQIADAAAAVNDAINAVDSVGAPPVVAVNDSNASQNGETPGSGGSSLNGNQSNGSSSDNGQSNADNSSNSNASGSSPSAPANQPSPPAGGLPAVITVGDVAAAQNAVDQTSNQIQSIQQQITDYSVMSSGGSGSGGSDQNNSYSDWNQDLSGANSNGGGDSSDYMQYIPPEDQPSTGPKLIQGDNPFQ